MKKENFMLTPGPTVKSQMKCVLLLVLFIGIISINCAYLNNLFIHDNVNIPAAPKSDKIVTVYVEDLPIPPEEPEMEKEKEKDPITTPNRKMNTRLNNYISFEFGHSERSESDEDESDDPFEIVSSCSDGSGIKINKEKEITVTKEDI